MDEEVGKYRKKKPQTSKSAKRADHKHDYERAITIHINPFDTSILSFFWTERCSICGRLGKWIGEEDDFKKTEYHGRHVYGRDVFLSKEEILKKFPDVPVYETDPDDMWNQVRIR